MQVRGTRSRKERAQDKKMSKYNLDEIDEDKRDSIPRKGRKILGGVAPRSEQQDVTRHGMPG